MLLKNLRLKQPTSFLCLKFVTSVNFLFGSLLVRGWPKARFFALKLSGTNQDSMLKLDLQ